MDQTTINAIQTENNKFIDLIIQKKYCLENETGLDDIKKRFKKRLLEIDPNNTDEINYFIDDMLFNTFIPGGSIIYGFGSNKNVSLSNCYYVPITNDSIDGIGKTISENMKVFSWRGGVGNSFEILRPKGSNVNNAARTSTGSVSFLPLFSNATQTVGQNGRRGASIFTHAIWHPDIIDFIKSKAYPEEVFEKDVLNNTTPKITGANISVKLNSNFINSYKNKSDWNLVFPDIGDKNYNDQWNGKIEDWKGKTKIYKTIESTELMRHISKSAWNFAEPGVLFWDTILEDTPMAVIPELEPRGVNPCGEQILADYDSCNLGALVLYKYVTDPYTINAKFDEDKFVNDIYISVYFLDQVLDENHHPLENQDTVNKLGRKIGLGVTGLGDMLAMLNITYGEPESLSLIEHMFNIKSYYETRASIKLAYELGSCPILDNKEYRKKYANHKFFKIIDADSSKIENFSSDIILSEAIIKYGIRNIGISTVAPTGTLSIIANNCTSGIEPLFSFEYERKSNLLDKPTRVIHPVLFDYLVKNNPEDLDLSKDDLMKKYHYVESHSLDYKKRIDVQSVCQKYTTDSISSTVNLPKETTIEDIENLYMYAYEKRLKGVTVYRDGCNLGGILIANKEEKIDTIETQKLTLANKEKSIRYRVKWKNTTKTYITVTYNENNEPLEIFTKVPKEAGLEKDTFNPTLYLERQSYWDSLCRLVSLSLRYKIPLNDIIKQLDKSSYSMYDLAAILKRTLLDGLKDKINNKNIKSINNAIECPECGEKSYIKENGCGVCLSCGYSKCS